MEKLFQIGVKALIANTKDQFLVMDSGDWHHKDQKRHWDIPGGRIQEGESILEALKREIKEETGLTKIGKVELFSSVISNFPDREINGRQVGLALIIYKVTISDNSKIALSQEHSGHEWVSSKEAATRLAYKYPNEFTNLL